MKRMSFPYENEERLKRKLPLCKIYLLGKNNRVPVRVLIDSGATDTILPINAAMDAGIKIPKLDFPIQYGGGQTNGVRIRTYFEIGARRLHADIVFVEKLEFPYGLLGRKGVFDEFNEVAFSERPLYPFVEFRW